MQRLYACVEIPVGNLRLVKSEDVPCPRSDGWQAYRHTLLLCSWQGSPTQATAPSPSAQPDTFRIATGRAGQNAPHITQLVVRPPPENLSTPTDVYIIHYTPKRRVLVKVNSTWFYPQYYIEVNGEVHTPAALSLQKPRDVDLVEGWVDLRVALSCCVENKSPCHGRE
jgi:hypothetical protein